MKFGISVILALAITLTSASIVAAGDTVKGKASNYAGTAGFMGMPGVALPGPLGGHYTGHINGYVTVCGDQCVELPIIDYCDCYWGSSDQRVVDLNYEAWDLVSDQSLSRGIIDVTLRFGNNASQQKGPAHWPTEMPDTAMSHG